MKTVKTSKHFKEYVDPVSKVPSYILSTRIAPQQQGFYFVNPSMTSDGRYLWFMCSFPPANQRFLGVVDFLTDEVRAFPETATGNITSSLVDEETGCVYFTNSFGVYLRTPNPDDDVKMLFPIPKEIRIGNHQVGLCTHLTFSADKNELFLDSSVGGTRFVLGSLNIHTGQYTEWYRPDYCRNHAQFHPKDKDLVLFAEDHFTNYEDGVSMPIRKNEDGVYMRLWTMRRGDSEPTMHAPMGNYATHEWWSPDGNWLLYCSGKFGVCGKNIYTGEERIFDPVSAWHSHCTKNMEYFVADVVRGSDGFYRGCASRVEFYNTLNKKAVNIVTLNPMFNTKADSWMNVYHMDPHPRFNGDDKYIVFTAAVNGKVDLAVTAVEDLI